MRQPTRFPLAQPLPLSILGRFYYLCINTARLHVAVPTSFFSFSLLLFLKFQSHTDSINECEAYQLLSELQQPQQSLLLSGSPSRQSPRECFFHK